MADIRCPMHIRREALENVRGDAGRFHTAVRQLADAGDLPGGACDTFAMAVDRALVSDCATGDLANPDSDLEFLFESKRPVVLTGRRYTRPADSRLLRVNAQADFTP